MLRTCSVVHSTIWTPSLLLSRDLLCNWFDLTILALALDRVLVLRRRRPMGAHEWLRRLLATVWRVALILTLATALLIATVLALVLILAARRWAALSTTVVTAVVILGVSLRLILGVKRHCRASLRQGAGQHAHRDKELSSHLKFKFAKRSAHI